MDNVTRIADRTEPATETIRHTSPNNNNPISFDCQLPGGPNGFWKYADATEEGDETYNLSDIPIDPTGWAARLGLHEGSIVNYESFIMSVNGFTLDNEDKEIVVLDMGNGGAGISGHIACQPHILESASTWGFRGLQSVPHVYGDPAPTSGQWLYIIRNPVGKIIYIGISVNATNRWTQHQADKPWFNEAATFERIWYPTREAVESAEAILIAQIRPPYNTQHNPDRQPA